PKSISTSASIPWSPVVPVMPGIQPGAAIVKCQGSLCVIVGGATSFEVYGSGPAKRTGAERTIVANTVPPQIDNLILMARCYCPRRPNPTKLIAHQSRYPISKKSA